MSRRRSKIFVGFLVAALILAGCRGGDSGGTDISGTVTTGVGVTMEPCPKAVNKDHGCIYLGSISDLTGPFSAFGVPATEARQAFWQRVNEQGGIGDYDVDVATYLRDNKYNPQTHNQVYQEIKDDVLALAQSLGSATTAAIIDDLRANEVGVAAGSFTSLWAFEDVILESGINSCLEAMNIVDYAIEKFDVKTIMAVHYAGDYGNDAAAGVKVVAERRGLTFINVQTPPGQDNQAAAIDAIVSKKPDLVVLSTGPTDAGVVVGQAAARGYQGKFIGSAGTWTPSLLKGPAAPALQALYLESQGYQTFNADTPGHRAMREALGTVQQAHDGYTAAWMLSYPLKAALEKAVENGNLTRKGLLQAATSLPSVDYEGMLPEGAGNYAAGPDGGAVRMSLIYKPDTASPTGLSPLTDFFAGPTAKAYKLDRPCYEKL